MSFIEDDVEHRDESLDEALQLRLEDIPETPLDALQELASLITEVDDLRQEIVLHREQIDAISSDNACLRTELEDASTMQRALDALEDEHELLLHAYQIHAGLDAASIQNIFTLQELQANYTNASSYANKLSADINVLKGRATKTVLSDVQRAQLIAHVAAVRTQEAGLRAKEDDMRNHGLLKNTHYKPLPARLQALQEEHHQKEMALVQLKRTASTPKHATPEDLQRQAAVDKVVRKEKRLEKANVAMEKEIAVLKKRIGVWRTIVWEWKRPMMLTLVEHKKYMKTRRDALRKEMAEEKTKLKTAQGLLWTLQQKNGTLPIFKDWEEDTTKKAAGKKKSGKNKKKKASDAAAEEELEEAMKDVRTVKEMVDVQRGIDAVTIPMLRRDVLAFKARLAHLQREKAARAKAPAKPKPQPVQKDGLDAVLTPGV